MDIINIILEKIQKLPKQKQNVLVDFIDLLSNKDYEIPLDNENQEWSKLSLENAMKDTKDDPSEYSEKDLKKKF